MRKLAAAVALAVAAWGLFALGLGAVYALTTAAHGQPLPTPDPRSYAAPDGRTFAQLVAAHVLPDPAATPSVINPKVTPQTLRSTVCVFGWTATVRPPTSWTNRIKAAELPPGHGMLEYELDHIVSIEDGGAPADPKNLFMMVYADRYGARVKDVLETYMKRALCTGAVTLAQARAALAPNWLQGYVRYIGPLP